MKAKTATMADVEYVLAHLSEQHRAEYAAAGVEREKIVATFRELVRAGSAETAWIDNRPVGVLGLTKECGFNTTWFLATPAFFQRNLKTVRFSRYYFRRMADRVGPLFIALHPTPFDVERWLRLIGWEKFAESVGKTVFVYR